jgi:hypothetical protein
LNFRDVNPDGGLAKKLVVDLMDTADPDELSLPVGPVISASAIRSLFRTRRSRTC